MEGLFLLARLGAQLSLRPLFTLSHDTRPFKSRLHQAVSVVQATGAEFSARNTLGFSKRMDALRLSLLPECLKRRDGGFICDHVSSEHQDRSERNDQ